MIDPDDGLNQLERTRRYLHRTADRICNAWPKALNDADARGLTSGGHGARHGSDPADPTGDAVCRTSRAAGWLAELYDVTACLLIAGGVPRSSLAHLWNRRDETRQLIHDAIDKVCDTWTLDDLIDFDPRSANYRKDVFGLERLANSAARFWPPPAVKGDVVGGTVVGDDEIPPDCGFCHGPVLGGRTESGQLRRRFDKDGVAYHNLAGYGHGACWWTVWRQQRASAA